MRDGRIGGSETIGVALGSGGARGWCHIGALNALAARGIRPDVVAGCSMGALVGAAYATGRLEALEAWAGRLTPRRMLALLDLSLGRGGLMEGGRIQRFLREILPDTSIEAMDIPFIAIATDLGSGQEIWLKEGSLLEAVRASIALPGIFSPYRLGGSWLVDGGLCNPVPVSAARALGAEIVIAVNPNSKLRRRGPLAGAIEADTAAATQSAAEPPGPLSGLGRFAPGRISAGLTKAAAALSRRRASGPSYLDVVSTTLDIMSDRIRASRLAGEPPHVLLQPQLSHRSVLEFYRATEAIAEGRASVEREAATLDAFTLCG